MAQTQILAMYALWPWPWRYCKCGYFRLRKISWKWKTDITRECYFRDARAIYIAVYRGCYFRVGVIFAIIVWSRKTRKLPPRENFHVYSMTLVQGHDIPLGHGQQLCEIISIQSRWGVKKLWPGQDVNIQTDRVIPTNVYSPQSLFAGRGGGGAARSEGMPGIKPLSLNPQWSLTSLLLVVGGPAGSEGMPGIKPWSLNPQSTHDEKTALS